MGVGVEGIGRRNLGYNVIPMFQKLDDGTGVD